MLNQALGLRITRIAVGIIFCTWLHFRSRDIHDLKYSRSFWKYWTCHNRGILSSLAKSPE